MNLTKQLALTWNLGRAAHFAYQQRILPLVAKLATGSEPWQPENLREKRKALFASAYALLKEDAENIAQGAYPLEVLRPEPYWRHSLRFLKILTDSARISRRRKGKKHREFSREASARLRELPGYYRRNFHFQTDGYLSVESAELYDHQVDLLFLGTTDAMRRSLLAAVKKRLPASPRLLEIGCGTGRLTHFVSLALPTAQVTALDPSAPYLKKARGRIGRGSRVDFRLGFGENTGLKSSSFAGVYTSFLFHELPPKVRLDVMKEAVRVTRNGGYIAILDSLQLGDEARFDWALRRFPVDFHEPFYQSYIQDRMEDWPRKIAGIELVESSFHFLGKVCLFRVKKRNR